MVFTYAESVIWALVVVLFIIIIMLIIYLKILRNDIRTKVKNKEKYTAFVEQNLVEFLYADEPDKELSENQLRILKKLKKGVKSKQKRRIMIDTFSRLREEISGNMTETIYKLYEKMGLLKYAIRKLRSKKWYLIALAIRDLRNFRVKKAQYKIKAYINHPREEVRREAHMYFVELFGFEGLKFLDDLEKPLSKWDQVLFLGILEDLGSDKIEDVTKWLYADNDYVVLFILNIVKAFNRLETKEILLELLHHDNEEIRKESIKVLTHFEVLEAKKILKNKVKRLSLEETILFFNYLEKTATIDDALFVVGYTSHENFDIKLKALKILQKVDKTLYDRLEKISEDNSYNKIISHLDLSYGF